MAAGIYQITPLKNFCLRHCRSPVAFLLHVSGYKGRFRDVRVGLYHGLYCVGCCWGLMLVLITVGIMNLAWMAAIAAAVLLEKTWRHGIGFSRAIGAALDCLRLLRAGLSLAAARAVHGPGNDDVARAGGHRGIPGRSGLCPNRERPATA